MQRSDIRWGQELWRQYTRHNTSEQPDEGIRRLTKELMLILAAVQHGIDLPFSRRQLEQISSGLMPLSAQLGAEGRAKFEVHVLAACLHLCNMQHQAAMSSHRQYTVQLAPCLRHSSESLLCKRMPHIL